MMITCLVIPFVSQRLKNTWPSVIMHFTQNGLGNIAFVTVLLMQLLGVK
jgi:hypothetical protein